MEKTNQRKAILMKCVACGSRQNLQRHHVSYKPEIIAILCQSCHLSLHGRLRDQDFRRVTVSMCRSLKDLFDAECDKRGYTRSEALRGAMRRMLEVWTGRRL